MGEGLEVGGVVVSQGFGLPEDAAAKGLVGVEEAFEVIVDEFGRRVVVALDLVDDHFALLLEFGLREGAVEDDVGEEREGTTEMLPWEGGIIDHFLLACVSVEVAAYALHAVEDLEGGEMRGALKRHVLYEMSHSALVRLLVARASGHGDASIDDVR